MRITPLLRLLLFEVSEADAEQIVVALRRTQLRTQAQRVSSKNAFVAALATFRPEVVLFRHGVASFGALAALESVRAATPGTPLIVLAATLDEGDAVAFVRAGAEDIVLKANLSRLSSAIGNALAVRRKLRELSPRQLQVLQLIAESNTTREIARALRVGVKTAETHRAELMRRLGLHDAVTLVRYALRTGVVAPDEP